MLTIEAILVCMLVIGGVTTVVLLPAGSGTQGLERASLQEDTQDALSALAHQRIGPTTLLEQGLSEILPCTGPTPPLRCADGTDLRARLDAYLGAGVEHRLVVSNGLGSRALDLSRTPAGEAAAASAAFSPTWNFSFVSAPLSCRDPTAAPDVQFIPLRNGYDVGLGPAQVTMGNATTVAQPLLGGSYWNATLPVGAHLAGAAAAVAATADGLGHPGSALVGVCALGALDAPLRSGLANSTLSDEAGAVPPGGEALFAYDLRPLLSLVPQAVLEDAWLDVHEPIAPLPGEPPVLAERIPLGAAATGAASWRVPENAFYGAHPVALRASLVVETPTGPVPVEARLLDEARVSLLSGHLPVDPVYRITLQTWHEGWG